MTNSNGLDLSEDEFARMKLKDQLVVLFRNTRNTNEIVRTVATKLKFHQWQIAGVIAISVFALGILVQHIMGK